MIRFHSTLFSCLLIFLICSCQSRTENNQEKIEVEAVIFDNSKIANFSVYTGKVKTAVFTFPKENSYKHGSTFTEFHHIEDNILIVDREVSEISCISKSGEIQWVPTPSSPGIDRYDIVGDVEVDFLNKEIYIEDLMKNVIDVFNFNGEYQRSIDDVPFIDFALLNKNELLLDITELDDQVGLLQNPPVRKRFRHVTSTKRVDNFPAPNQITENQIPVNNHNRFNLFDGLLQHRMPYEDIVYAIKEDLLVEPILRFSFTQASGFVEVARNPEIEIVWKELAKQNMAEPSLVIYDDSKDRTYANYWQGEGFYFVMIEEGKQVVSPGKYYHIGDLTLKAPTHYNDGRFYQQLFRYEFDFLQKAYAQNLSHEEIKAGLEKLEAEIGDDDDILIISVAF